ncbi:UDP-glucose 4-epimerase GalE [Citrobacter sedlakii]|uniref:UDP-glucose 4-epimerase GalE n=1 Tax=Citrobacter sedlakii TaxID=67826 RepID=UPI0033359203
MAILITGGAGYIGSHTALSLLESGYELVIMDNFSNSCFESVERLQKLVHKSVKVYVGDIGDESLLQDIFTNHKIESVLHFAGLKSVGESVTLPIKYYDNNVAGTLSLIRKMIEHKITHFIFSSSATVYGSPENIPLVECSKVGGTTNPYGSSKLMVEHILKDLTNVDPAFRVTVLRYFNPVGAHSSGTMGEDPNGIPNNLMPYVCQVAIGKHKQVSVFGSDYPTKDGTGVRDYIHVMDLAEGHVAALKHISEGPNHKIYNLGTGIGYSVLEILNAFERVTSRKVPYVLSERRPGDIAECWSDPSKAQKELGWKAKRGLDEMIRDAWNWQLKNPNGYKRDC